MQQSQPSLKEHPEDRNMDPYNALDKVIRLDKKHTNFDYYDSHRNMGFRVSYPIPPFDAPNNEHLLKGFWRHINNYYFKKIEQNQLQRLDYLETLLQPANQCIYFVDFEGDVRFSGSMEFWYTVERLFSESYLNRYKRSEVDGVDCKNWLEEMFLVWERTYLKDCKKKKAQHEFEKIENCFMHLGNFDSISDPKKKLSKLKTQETQLSYLLPSQDDDDQISLQIQEEQANLYNECYRNRQLLEQLKSSVRHQIDFEDVSIIKYGEDDQEEEVTRFGQESKLSKTKRKIEKMETVDVVKKYLEYCIRNLEKRQIAESIAKITNLNKGKGKDELSYEIQFETGMNISKISISQSTLDDLNKLRQYNLFKFYNTSLKTPYSFICQNYFGFRWIYENRNQPCALKDKNINQEMKRGKVDFLSSKAAKQFEKFDICHHCKLIYPQAYLLQCQYNSSKNGAPITPSSYYDPYISQIIKLQQPKLSNRFVGRRRNSYLGYTKVSNLFFLTSDEEYICERKFCKYCMRQNYQDSLDKNGLCPFCQGNCFCTRCARNDMIVRLKSMFLLLGGDVNKLEDQSQMEKVIKGEVQNSAQLQRNNARSKTKSVKKPVGGTPARLNEKMRNIRYQLEDLRILCDLVKRREKQKQKLVEIRCELFSRKLSVLGKGMDFKALNDSSINTLIEEEQAREQKKLKMKKKLNRMI